jgi:hypothetical protein
MTFFKASCFVLFIILLFIFTIFFILRSLTFGLAAQCLLTGYALFYLFFAKKTLNLEVNPALCLPAISEFLISYYS